MRPERVSLDESVDVRRVFPLVPIVPEPFLVSSRYIGGSYLGPDLMTNEISVFESVYRVIVREIIS